MNITPEHITHLEPNEIFVFGSNYAGRHGLGAAKAAIRFGAKYGVGTGPCGQTFGIATKDRNLRVLPLDKIQIQVEAFYRYLLKHPELSFLVTPIGCGRAGYSPKDIAPMFANFRLPNVCLPQSFWNVLNK